MNRIWLALAALAPALGCYAPVNLDLQELLAPSVQEVVLRPSEEDEKLLLLSIDGAIANERGSGLISSSQGLVARVQEQLLRAEQDPDVRGLLLRIDSPGGDVTASDIIYRELCAWKQRTGRPIVALFLGTAASGGYYVAQAADRIVAQPTCITGSIGVIATLPDLSGLLEKVGVQVHLVTSGARKGAGNPFQPLADEDRKEFQALVDALYERFLTVVAAGRAKRLTAEEIRPLADGRVFTAEAALAAKLVDEVGYFDEALTALEGLAHTQGAAVVCYREQSRGLGGETLYSSRGADPLTLPEASLAELLRPVAGPAFSYLWLPGARGGTLTSGR
jgi:protease-4